MNPVIVELTPTEAQQTVALFDLATKAAGLEAARLAMPIIEKLQKATAEVSGQPANKEV